MVSRISDDISITNKIFKIIQEKTEISLAMLGYMQNTFKFDAPSIILHNATWQLAFFNNGGMTTLDLVQLLVENGFYDPLDVRKHKKLLQIWNDINTKTDFFKILWVEYVKHP